MPPDPFVAACERSGHLALAAFRNHHLVELRRHLARGGASLARLERFLADHGAETVLVEPGSSFEHALRARGYAVETLSVAEATRRLVPDAPRATRAALLIRLVSACPKLRRFVTVLSAVHEVALSERTRTLMLLPVAMGLAALREEPLPSDPTHST